MTERNRKVRFLVVINCLGMRFAALTRWRKKRPLRAPNPLRIVLGCGTQRLQWATTYDALEEFTLDAPPTNPEEIMPRHHSILILISLAAAASVLFVSTAAADHYQRRFPQGYDETRFNFIANLVEVREGNILVVEDVSGQEWSFQLEDDTLAPLERRSPVAARKKVDLTTLEQGQQLRLRVQTTTRRLQSVTVLVTETTPTLPGQGLGYQKNRT